jgi:nicotinate-nucleotide adenylyltransferase
MWDRYEESYVVDSCRADKIDIPKKFLTLNIDENISSSEIREHMDISKLPKECTLEISEYYKENNEK